MKTASDHYFPSAGVLSRGEEELRTATQAEMLDITGRSCRHVGSAWFLNKVLSCRTLALKDAGAAVAWRTELY